MEGIKNNNKRIRPLSFILVLSVVLMIVLFFVQSRSDKSIREMQQGNELAVKTFQINNSLQEIINQVYFIESQTRKQINANDISLTPVLRDTIQHLQQYVNEAGKLSTKEGKTKESFLLLEQLIQQKIVITKDILATGLTADSAKAKLTGELNKNLIDSIYITASDIQINAEKELQQTIIENATVSNQVLVISRSLTIFALITIVLSATLMIRHLNKNNRLIDALDKARIKADIASRTKEQFLANMSHEIRTPLNSIIGFSNLASKTNLTGEQKDYISFIKNSGQNLLYIINDILDFSKLEAGKLLISTAPFNLKEIAHFIEMMFQVQLNDKQIHFASQIEENIPLDLIGDDDRLKQILTNLVSNAIKFTGPGGNISLSMNMAKKEDETIFIQFAVKDSGIGIPEEKLKTIFERFEQADSATTRKYGGTGLGLSIVKQLITLQNGTIEVSSKENEGSIFTATIPYKINLQAETTSNRNDKNTTEKAFNTEARILIAEDNKMNQMLLKFMFQNWGVSFTLAKDGKEAIELIDQNEYDIVLLDIQMPHIDGYGVADWIRNTKQLSVPVIAMTAHSMPNEIEKSKQAGMNGYLPKPLIEERVIEIFNQYIPKLNTDMLANEFHFVSVSDITALVGNDPAIIKELVNHFKENYPDELNQLNKAFESRDKEQVFTLAHNLKTTATSLKANSPLLEQITTIEQLKNTESDWEKIGGALAELNENSVKLLAEIDAIIQTV